MFKKECVMRFNSAPVSCLYVKFVAQKRNGEILAYTMLASDQTKVTQKSAVYNKTFTADVEEENFPMFAEQARVKLNFKNVVVL
jgi:phosphoribosylcarboxyaminoimidazole (NCAIR) mutase